MNSRPADTSCPLCNGDNRCEVARTGRIDAHCWCRDAAIATDVKLAAATRGESCICADCVAIGTLIMRS